MRPRERCTILTGVSNEGATRTAEILAAIAKSERIPVERITLDSSFEELGIDSLDGFNLLYEVENQFNVTISDEDAREIRDVRSLIAVVERLLAQAEAASNSSPA